ncbi:hypothetical protein PTTG_07755 [Puccinia triticina 1-1 BBBD Race 1]|uniref:Vacuolar protein 8 n=1 Tax=Puccinia triticina (isolate 1-1 / race 1 (BBBD)) TaxID=630390 RepID=A0A180GF73_PUCT1|nr:hypothetical protein PTTG_07755 [Puccinia triticina 1-1 BBBD Race 1]
MHHGAQYFSPCAYAIATAGGQSQHQCHGNNTINNAPKNAIAVGRPRSSLLSPNVEVQCNAVGCITNLATHYNNKAKIAKSGALVPLNRLARSKDTRVQRNATGVLLNMTHSDENRQQLINAGSIPILVSLLSSLAASCVRNVSITPQNKSPIIEANFLNPLIELLAYDENKEIQCHSISTLRNLAASSEKNKAAIVEAGAIELIKELVLSVPLSVQSETTACAAVLGISEKIKGNMLDLGILEVLIPLTNSVSVEVQGNSAAAIGNLSSKAEDYTAFNQFGISQKAG